MKKEIEKSLPARGVWIEIITSSAIWSIISSLPARGVWIEIGTKARSRPSRSSLPARGVWIEIHHGRSSTKDGASSLPARGVWIEISMDAVTGVDTVCHSPRGECGLKCPHHLH